MPILKDKIETDKKPVAVPVVRYLSVRIVQEISMDKLVLGVADGLFRNFDRKRFIERGGTPEAADKIEAAIAAEALRSAIPKE